jgi:probable rRNA maturation factor
MPIRFFSEDTDFILAHPRKTSEWIKATAKKERCLIEELNYIFCSDTYLLTINQDFLKHNTFTDIITFDYSTSKQSLEGEIYISVDRVSENAFKFKRDFEEELHRVIIHGVLHLIGYKDKKGSDKTLMRKKEDTYLSLRS